MEELKNQANELINGNIDSYPALSREAAGKAILMLIEKVENLQEQYERGFKDGHNCCAYEKEKLLAENARYREALDKAEKALKFYRREFD